MDTKTSNAVQLSVQGVHCAACGGHGGGALSGLAGVNLPSVNVATANAYVELEPTHPAAVTDMIAAIDKKGFHATEITADNKEEVFAATQTALHDEAETKKKNFFIALILSLPVFITDMGAHLIPGFGDWLHSFITARSLAYFQFVLTTLVILFPGWSFFSFGFRPLAQRAPDLITLVAIGAGSAWLYSTVATIAPQLLPQGAAHLYFEAEIGRAHV